MTVTQLTIANEALFLCGANRVKTIGELAAPVTESARVIGGLWDTILEAMLKDHNWNFATKRAWLSVAGKAITGISAAEPPVVDSVAHGFSDADWILIEDVVGMTEVNLIKFVVTNKADDTLELYDGEGNKIDGSAYTAYVSGGTIKLAPAFGFTYMHPLPSDCLHVQGEFNNFDFAVENGYLLSDLEFPKIYYTKQITDYADLSAVFRRALTLALARDACIPLKGSVSLQERLEKRAEGAWRSAKARDAKEGTPQKQAEGSWITDRE